MRPLPGNKSGSFLTRVFSKMHANLWSVVLRNSVLSILILALWPGWYALVPVTIALLWTWYNHRIFLAPATPDPWTSKAVFGERVWLNRDDIPVPVFHRTAPDLLWGVSGTGMLSSGASSRSLSDRPCPVWRLSTQGNSGSLTGWHGSGRI